MKKKLAFDIGAHKGEKTQQLLNQGFTNIVAVEPLYDSPFPTADNRVTWIRSIVASSNAPRVIYPLGTISTISRKFIEESRFSASTWGDPVAVLSTTLDAIIERYGVPSYAKIDVEGAEKEVLMGLTTGLIPLLSFEWHSEFRSEAIACVQALQSLGYSKFSLQFEDSIADLDSIECPRNAVEVMADFDAMCSSRHLAWGQLLARL